MEAASKKRFIFLLQVGGVSGIICTMKEIRFYTDPQVIADEVVALEEFARKFGGLQGHMLAAMPELEPAFDSLWKAYEARIEEERTRAQVHIDLYNSLRS
jgi:hypothetical protein